MFDFINAISFEGLRALMVLAMVLVTAVGSMFLLDLVVQTFGTFAMGLIGGTAATVANVVATAITIDTLVSIPATMIPVIMISWTIGGLIALMVHETMWSVGDSSPMVVWYRSLTCGRQRAHSTLGFREWHVICD